MIEKFSIEDLIIRIMPGGFLLAVLIWLFFDNTKYTISQDLDFLYTFIFFCTSYIIGELIQTITHEVEWIINIFFRLYRPSEVFLYKENPVLKNEKTRNEIMLRLNLGNNEKRLFEKKYCELPILWWKKDKKERQISQNSFMKLYSRVSNTEEIKISNRNYLFSRVMVVEFLTIFIVLAIKNYHNLLIVLALLSVVFLWRSRGIARGLVEKTVYLNTKE